MTQVITSQQQNLWNYQNIKFKQWTFGIQAIPDACDTEY